MVADKERAQGGRRGDGLAGQVDDDVSRSKAELGSRAAVEDLGDGDAGLAAGGDADAKKGGLADVDRSRALTVFDAPDQRHRSINRDGVPSAGRKAEEIAV